MNHYLKACASDVTVVAFIIFPTKNTRYRGYRRRYRGYRKRYRGYRRQT